jgi:hypothetical protein
LVQGQVTEFVADEKRRSGDGLLLALEQAAPLAIALNAGYRVRFTSAAALVANLQVWPGLARNLPQAEIRSRR